MISNQTVDVIRRRRSIRSFRDQQISEEEVQVVVEAGLYAPNAGDQAWHFTIVQNRELLIRLNSAAKTASTGMGIPHLSELGSDAQFDCLYGAPTLIIVSADERSPIPLDIDCAAATENMLLAAESLGLGSCWIFFVLLAFDSADGPELRRALSLPEHYKPRCAAVFGYKQGLDPVAPARRPNLVTYVR